MIIKNETFFRKILLIFGNLSKWYHTFDFEKMKPLVVGNLQLRDHNGNFV